MGKYDFDRYIERRGTNAMNTDGWRPYIFGDVDGTAKFNYADDEFVRMWVADMEFGVAPEILDAIRARVDKEIFGYTSPTTPDYAIALNKWYQEKYDWQFNPEHLWFSHGVVEAFYELIGDLCDPAKGDKVITMTSAYGYFLHACEFNQVELVCCPMHNEDGVFSLELEKFREMSSDPSVKVLLLCNPHNPTGHMWTLEELQEIGKIAKENDLFVIDDEIHCDLIRKGKKHIPFAKACPDYTKMAMLSSASKTFNIAGLLFSNTIIIDDEERAKYQAGHPMDMSLNPLSLAAHTAAYEKGGPWLEELKEYLDESFAWLDGFLKERIPDAVFTIPDATYLAWVDLRKVLPDVDDLPMFFANEAGVLLEGGSALFVADADGFVRLNLAMPRATVQEGLKRMADAIDKHNGK